MRLIKDVFVVAATQSHRACVCWILEATCAVLDDGTPPLSGEHALWLAAGLLSALGPRLTHAQFLALRGHVRDLGVH